MLRLDLVNLCFASLESRFILDNACSPFKCNVVLYAFVLPIRDELQELKKML